MEGEGDEKRFIKIRYVRGHPPPRGEKTQGLFNPKEKTLKGN